jgi:hypothetical protein
MCAGVKVLVEDCESSTLYVPDADRVFLVDVYDKDEADDLTFDEKRLLASLAETYREEVRRSQKRH